ncbi:MAG: hypothetical protein QXD32_07615 [Nitrososphaerota archaeon]
MAWSRVSDLVRQLPGGNPAQWSATLPAGKIILVVGANRDTAAPTVNSVSHPAVSSAARVGTAAVALGSTNKDVVDVWELVSGGGSGTFSISFATAPYFGGVWGATGGQIALANDRKEITSSTSSWTMVESATGADHGLAAAFVTLGTSGAGVSVDPWGEVEDDVPLGTSWHRMVVAATQGSVSGITQTVLVSAGVQTVAAGRLVLFGGGVSAVANPLMVARMPL